MNSAVAFTLFGYDVLWYGLVYSFGFLFAYIYYMKFFHHEKLNEEYKDTSSFILIFIPLICARLAFCFFYFPSHYLLNPLDIVKVYEGGMSIHGGIAGFFIGCWIVKKRYQVPVYSISDFFALPALLSLSVGRVGNFMNQELVGIPTQSGIGVIFAEYDNLKRYPYQLFASFKNLVVFQIMLYLYMFKRLKTGVMTLFAIFLYSLGRFFLDFTREPTTIIFSFPLGQWMSIVFMAVTFYLLYKIYNSGERGITIKHTHDEKHKNCRENNRVDKKNKR